MADMIRGRFLRTSRADGEARDAITVGTQRIRREIAILLLNLV
jgi:hypothetical protein